MFRREMPSVQVGDRFIKLDDTPGRTWVVVDLWRTANGLPHARMKSEGPSREMRIISVSVLADRHFCSPIPAKPGL